MNTKTEILNNLYTSRDRFIERKKRLISLSRRFSYYRLGIFLSGLFLILLSFFFISNLAAWIFLVLTFIIFGITAGEHNKINKGIKKNSFWISIKNAQIARIKINWESLPVSEPLIADERHSFDVDLSITGKYSILRLLDNSVSKEGSNLLKQWLLSDQPDRDQIIERQSLVKEIKPLHRFRDKLILNSLMVSPSKLESSKFISWLETKNNAGRLRKLLPWSFILVYVNIILFFLFLFAGVAPVFSIGILIYAALYFFNLVLVRDSFDKALHIEGELGKFYSILIFLEEYPFGSHQKLKAFCAPMLEESSSPRKHFKKIKNLINALSLRQNPLIALILNFIMPWDFYFSLKLEEERQLLAGNLHQWLDTWHNLQALNSLAEFAFLNPEYTFPGLLKEEGAFKAEGIGHPLIPSGLNVRNDFEINRSGTVDIITGSNMSGKSTFLKTLGCNLVLAYAGAPVNAAVLRISMFRIFTSIKIDDSVTDGISYFYAEVKRLKQLLDHLNIKPALPLFFLIDEIFRGTNNRERLTGSRAFIKALGNKNGSGLISTHDLELVKLEEEMKFIRNYHFREEASGNKLTFDYKVREGPSPSTNALKIMKLEGLPVD